MLDGSENGTSNQRLRVSLGGRVGAVLAIVLLLTIAFAILATNGLNTASAIFALFAVLSSIAIIDLSFVPYIELRDNDMYIRNRVASTLVPYERVLSVRPGWGGVSITRDDGSTVVVWAVQKANISRILKRRTRADQLSDDIMLRVEAASTE